MNVARAGVLPVMAVLVSVLLVGCGGSDDALTPPPAPPTEDSSAMAVGPLLVRPASAAGFTALEIPTGGPISLVALYGSQINYLASQALLDRIVYASGPFAAENLYICNLDGSHRVRLTNVSADDTAPAWSPDGRTIAFDRQRPAQDREVCLIGADGSSPRALTDNTDDDRRPTWAPEGRRLAFQTSRDGNSEVYVMYADGTGATNLTNDGATDQHPDWSPDLSNPLIAFCSNRDGNLELYKMREDGSSPTRLTNNTVMEHWPAFSPGGHEIAYESLRQGTFDILVTNTGGSSPTTLVAGPGADETVAYSSDGRFVCYASNADGDFELMLQQTEPPYDRWQLTRNSGIIDAYPDLGSPTLQTDRVLIGPAGSDWGGADPIWPNAYGVVTAYAEEGYRNLARIGVSAANAHTIEVSPLASTAQPMDGPAGVLVEAADIVNIREDGGRGRPTILWQLDPLDATAVVLYFSSWTGKLLAVMVIADQSYPAGAGAAAAAVTQRAEGDAVVAEGAFGAVFDGTGMRIADTAGAVRITEDAVSVIR